jgi:PTS system N-acetylglucosamine-specific IIC component
MIPVAILPAAAILMGIGYWIDPTGWGANNMLAALLIKSGAAIIDNMSVLVAIGVAFGMSNDKNGSAALTGFVGFAVVTTLLSPASVSMLQGINIDKVHFAFNKINNQFVGILVGIIAAELYNEFHSVQLPKALSFFSGKRIVPIIMSFTMIALSFILLYIWPIMFESLVSFGKIMKSWGPIGAGIFGFANRMLIPFGLHHALNSVFWFDVAGINDIPNFLAGGKTIKEFAEAGKQAKGIVGMYQAGFFPIMMFGLLGAAWAFIKTAKPKNRSKITSLMLAAAFASFFTGITEPLEFSFLFVAPLLYFFHALFTGLSLFIAAKMQWMAGFGFSAGLVDMILSTKNPLAVQWWMLLVQGVFFFFLYFFVFTGLIKLLNLKTPGREEDEEDETLIPLSDNHIETAELILKLIGGKENITTIDNCVTRLRLDVVDTSKIDQNELNKHVPGILVLGDHAVQIVIGLHVDVVADALTLLVTGERGTSAREEDAEISSTGSSTPSGSKPSTHKELAAAILPLIGGKGNVTSLDNCITRLRLEVKDRDIVDTNAIKKISSGIIMPGKKSVQIIIGTEVQFVADELQKIL